MEAADKRARAGKPVYPLMVGQPDCAPPAHAVEAARAALANDPDVHKYTHNAGTWQVRQSVAAHLTRRYGPGNAHSLMHGVATRPDEIVCSPGAVMSLASAMMALLDPGDAALLPDPAWPNYGLPLPLLGARAVPYPCHAEGDGAWLPDVAALRDAAAAEDGRAKVLLLNSPSNPTGRVLPRDTVRACVELAAEHDLTLVSDEIYADIVFDDAADAHASVLECVGSEAELARVVLVGGVSKSYAMCGYRVGFLRAHEDLCGAVTKLQEAFVSCGVPFAQAAAAAALDGPQDIIPVKRYQARRDVAVAALKRHGLYAYTPEGAFYLLVDVGQSREAGRASDTRAFCLELLRETGVAVAPGATFTARDAERPMVRVSLAASDEDVAEGMERLCAYVREHRVVDV